MAAVRRHLRVTRVAFVQALGRDTQFRAQTWTTIVVGMVEVVLGLIPALLVFSRTRQVNGWDLGGVVAVAGMFVVMLGVLGAFAPLAICAPEPLVQIYETIVPSVSEDCEPSRVTVSPGR